MYFSSNRCSPILSIELACALRTSVADAGRPEDWVEGEDWLRAPPGSPLAVPGGRDGLAPTPAIVVCIPNGDADNAVPGIG